MNKQTLSPDFWDVFVRDYWKQKPVVFKAILPRELLGGRDALETFGSYAAEALGQSSTPRIKRRGGAVRLFVEGRQIGPTELSKFIPRGDSLVEYIKAVGASFGGARVGVILNDIELFHEKTAAILRELLAPLISRVGIPAKNIESTLFAGDYDVTPFGIHKDDSADVLTLVLEGKKQMLVWPEEYFDEHPERLQQLVLGNEAIGLFRQDATVLEAEPGDIMYWPGSAYHVATSTGGVVATCGIGFWHKAALADMVSELVKDLLAAKLGGRNTVVANWEPHASVPSELEAAGGVLRELMNGGDFQKALAKAWKDRTERLGFLAYKDQA